MSAPETPTIETSQNTSTLSTEPTMTPTAPEGPTALTPPAMPEGDPTPPMTSTAATETASPTVTTTLEPSAPTEHSDSAAPSSTTETPTPFQTTPADESQKYTAEDIFGSTATQVMAPAQTEGKSLTPPAPPTETIPSISLPTAQATEQPTPTMSVATKEVGGLDVSAAPPGVLDGKPMPSTTTSQPESASSSATPGAANSSSIESLPSSTPATPTAPTEDKPPEVNNSNTSSMTALNTEPKAETSVDDASTNAAALQKEVTADLETIAQIEQNLEDTTEELKIGTTRLEALKQQLKFFLDFKRKKRQQ